MSAALFKIDIARIDIKLGIARALPLFVTLSRIEVDTTATAAIVVVSIASVK